MCRGSTQPWNSLRIMRTHECVGSSSPKSGTNSERGESCQFLRMVSDLPRHAVGGRDQQQKEEDADELLAQPRYTSALTMKKVAIGCLVVLVLGCVIIGGVAFWAYRRV